MKIVRVQYTTTLEYAAKNMENVTSVANELKHLIIPALNTQRIYYLTVRRSFISISLKMKRRTRL